MRIIILLFAALLALSTQAHSSETATITLNIYFINISNPTAEKEMYEVIKQAEKKINQEVFQGKNLIGFKVIAVRDFSKPFAKNHMINGFLDVEALIPYLQKLFEHEKADLHLFLFAEAFIVYDSSAGKFYRAVGGYDKNMVFLAESSRTNVDGKSLILIHEIGHWFSIEHLNEEICDMKEFIMCADYNDPENLHFSATLKNAFRNFYTRETGQKPPAN